jgi:hypothetical protein
LRRTSHDISEEFLRIANERSQFRVKLSFDIGLLFDLGAQEWLYAKNLLDANAVQSFEESNNVSVGHSDHFVDARGGSHAVQVTAARIFYTRVELRYHAQNLFGAFKRIE